MKIIKEEECDFLAFINSITAVIQIFLQFIP